MNMNTQTLKIFENLLLMESQKCNADPKKKVFKPKQSKGMHDMKYKARAGTKRAMFVFNYFLLCTRG